MMDECWIYVGQTNQGYGVYGGSYTHRRVYEALVGPIPEGLQLDHLCRNTLCYNPRHLEPVTPKENSRRRDADGHYLTKRTHCPKGHERIKENTITRPDGSHECRICNRDRSREYQARKRLLR